MQACGLCGHYEDNMDHILSSECDVFDVTYQVFQQITSLNVEAEFLGASSRCEANYVSYYLMVDIDHILHVHAIMCLNWAIWCRYCTRKLVNTPHNIPNSKYACNIINLYAVSAWTKPISPKWVSVYTSNSKQLGC